MEVCEPTVAGVVNQTEGGKSDECAPVKNRESVVQPVSVINNGAVEAQHQNGHTDTEKSDVTGETEQKLVNGQTSEDIPEVAASVGSEEGEQQQSQKPSENGSATAGESPSRDIQQPSEELPAELLQEDNSLTTVASLIDKAEAVPEAVPESEAQTAAPADAPSSTVEPEKEKNTEANTEESNTKELTSSEKNSANMGEKTTEDNKQQQDTTSADAEPAVNTGDSTTPAASSNVDEEPTPRKSGRKVKPTEKVLELSSSTAATDVEESVEAIAKELAAGASTDGSDEKKKSAKSSAKKSAGKEGGKDATSTPTAAGDAEGTSDADGKKSSAKKGRPKKKDLDEKVDNVTKLGNNMYFYTGPGGQDSPPPLTSDDEELDLDLPVNSQKTEKEAARKSNRAGKGRNPRLEREDEEVEMPKKLPPKPNLNPNWLKAAAKTTEKEKKTPTKKKVAAQEPQGSGIAVPDLPSTPSTVSESEATKETPMEMDESMPSGEERDKSPPKDEELPEFDPNKFTPGYVPKTVKKGDAEYVIVVQGVQDTGLCGKYWGDIGNLPSRRRTKIPETFKPGDTPEGNKSRRGSTGSTGSIETPPKKKTETAAVKSTKKQVTKPETSKSTDMMSAVEDSKESVTEEGSAAPQEVPAASASKETKPETSAETPKAVKTEAGQETEKKKRGRKRNVDSPAPEPKKQKASQPSEESTTQQNEDTDNKDQVVKKKGGKSSPEKSTAGAVSAKTIAHVSAALAQGVPAGQQRSVSCVSDTSTQKEVVVECFAPYDDHRWVNIGKERDGMTPDAVQYARALRPPYHLLSFLRIKGHSTKGMSCTDKNTMVFVVLEGEITVILHTTQFNAKKGDSFYIPPKNYYNLINQKAREAELSLIQFQYDGPLPTVNPATAQTS